MRHFLPLRLLINLVNAAPMKLATPHSLTRLLVMIAILGQSFLPGIWAIAADHGLVSSDIICNPSQSEPTALLQSQTVTLLSALGVEKDTHDNQPEHCSNCVLLLGVALPSPQISSNRILYGLDVSTPMDHQTSRFHSARGPPLGTRAPPLFA